MGKDSIMKIGKHLVVRADDPLEAMDEIMRTFNIPYGGWDGDYEYWDVKTGRSIHDEEGIKRRGKAYFGATFYLNGRYYRVTGMVLREKGARHQWVADAEVEEIEFP